MMCETTAASSSGDKSCLLQDVHENKSAGGGELAADADGGNADDAYSFW